MNDESLTKDRLNKEMMKLRQRVAELEMSETERKKIEKQIERLNRLLEEILRRISLNEKLKLITDGIVQIFDAEFSRIWVTHLGDRCDSGCFHANVTEGPHVCQNRGLCLHLISSSGRYTHIDGTVHQRVPFGCYKIGSIAAGNIPNFLTNDVLHDPLIHNQEWARELSLVSCAGYRLLSSTGEPMGVLALFSKHAISYNDDILIEGLANTVSQIIITARAAEKLRRYSEQLENIVEERTKELKETQEKLVRKEKLALLGQLAGGVGHDLRNPLGAIKNAVYFLNMVLENPDKEIKETIEIIQNEVETSESIISSLLDFARPKDPLRRQVNINDVIREALSSIKVPENIEVINQLKEGIPIILADPDQIGRVFTNIILNGIQAMPEGGQLYVKSEIPNGNWITISFTDTGPGISEENMKKIFEPLFTTKAKGIGLGLAIVKTIIEAHGGLIEVQSKVGVGSTFTVKLPINGGEVN